MKKFIYNIETLNFITTSEISDYLNTMAKKGWVLICVVEDRYYFRKKIKK